MSRPFSHMGDPEAIFRSKDTFSLRLVGQMVSLAYLILLKTDIPLHQSSLSDCMGIVLASKAHSDA